MPPEVLNQNVEHNNTTLWSHHLGRAIDKWR